ncbi:multicopper oxidase domain-containing protein, partial [Modestobacter sp. NPDC049651]
MDVSTHSTWLSWAALGLGGSALLTATGLAVVRRTSPRPAAGAPPARDGGAAPGAVTRRSALLLGGLGVLATLLGGRSLTTRAAAAPGAAPAPGPVPLTEPPTLRSAGGLLEVRLVAAEGPMTVAGRRATALGYNGGLPGPTLRVRPGDRLRVELVNRLADPTNLHLHGVHVSPEGNADNVFVSVAPGGAFHYEYQIPGDHPPGVYWYHPHHHGHVATQLFGGLYGALVIEDPQELPVTRERVLVVSDITLDAAGRVAGPTRRDLFVGREGRLVMVDGQTGPLLTARPGERERWRVVNACPSRYVRLRLDGQRLDLLGIDSGALPRPRRVDEVVLLTGNRADLLVTAVAGSSALQVLGVDRFGGRAGGGRRDVSGDVGPIATFQVSGPPVPGPPTLPARPALPDLRSAPLAQRRRLVLSMDRGTFAIDGREFDPDRLDTLVRLGTVEEWTVVNASPMDHPFHLHVWPVQVLSVGNQVVDGVQWRDVVNVPALGQTVV